MGVMRRSKKVSSFELYKLNPLSSHCGSIARELVHCYTWGRLRIVTHLLSATVRVYSLVAPCRLPDLTSLAPLGSVSGQPGLSRGPLPGYKTVSKWRLQLQDSTPFLLLSQRFCTTLHTSASLGCYLLFTHMPDCPLAPLGQV